MNFEFVEKEQWSDWRHINSTDTLIKLVTLQEVERVKKKYLAKFNTSSLPPNSKVYFCKKVDFPRYRLRDYGKDKNISIVRKIEDADIVIGDKTLFQKLIPIHGYNEKKGKISFFMSSSYIDYYDYNKLITQMEVLDELYNYTGDIMDVSDLRKIVCSEGLIFGLEEVKNINNMLRSTNINDVSIALEMIANSNLNENLVCNYFLLRLNSNLSNVKHNSFLNSVNYKAVKFFYDTINLNCEKNYNNYVSVLVDELLNADITFTNTDLEVIHYFMEEELKSTHKFIESINISFNLPKKDCETPRNTINISGLPILHKM